MLTLSASAPIITSKGPLLSSLGASSQRAAASKSDVLSKLYLMPMSGYVVGVSRDSIFMVHASSENVFGKVHFTYELYIIFIITIIVLVLIS